MTPSKTLSTEDKQAIRRTQNYLQALADFPAQQAALLAADKNACARLVQAQKRDLLPLSLVNPGEGSETVEPTMAQEHTAAAGTVQFTRTPELGMKLAIAADILGGSRVTVVEGGLRNFRSAVRFASLADALDGLYVPVSDPAKWSWVTGGTPQALSAWVLVLDCTSWALSQAYKPGQKCEVVSEHFKATLNTVLLRTKDRGVLVLPSWVDMEETLGAGLQHLMEVVCIVTTLGASVRVGVESDEELQRARDAFKAVGLSEAAMR